MQSGKAESTVMRNRQQPLVYTQQQKNDKKEGNIPL
jgi:hypothetical protein